MTKVIERKERIMDQLGKGYRTRYVEFVEVIVAQDRTDDSSADSDKLADAIKNEQAMYKGLFVAPCNGRILRCFANALQWPGNAAAGALTGTWYKSTPTAETALTVALSLEAAGNTAKTAVDATPAAGWGDNRTLGINDMNEGEMVRLVIAVANADVLTKSENMVLGIEFMPTEP